MSDTDRTQFDPQSDSRGARQMEQSEGSGERHGTYEPDDSRNVTGAGGQGIGAPGGSDQQAGGERWGGQQSQQQDASGQFGEEQSGSGQQSQFEQGSDQQAGEIREHMEVIGADGAHVGTVDKVEGDRIKLTKADSGQGSHQGHHHYISRGLVAGIEGDQVRLSASGANAVQFEEEE